MCLVVFITGCAQVKMMLAKHDPAMADHYVRTVVAVDDASCEAKDTLVSAVGSARLLAKYAEFRDDPQVESAKAVLVNLQKAEASPAACGRWLSLAKQRLEVLNKAWSTR